MCGTIDAVNISVISHHASADYGGCQLAEDEAISVQSQRYGEGFGAW
jgi:hypothetical protein